MSQLTGPEIMLLHGDLTLVKKVPRVLITLSTNNYNSSHSGDRKSHPAPPIPFSKFENSNDSRRGRMMESASVTTLERTRPAAPGILSRPETGDRDLQLVRSAKAPEIPDYMQEIYYWAYLNPRNVRLLNRESVVRLILWQQHTKLRRAAFAEVEPGQKVLQSTCVYGKYLPMLADHIGPAGHLDLVDIAEVQLLSARGKLRGRRNVTLHHANVLDLDDSMYDRVMCYFLLHEIPDDHKRAAMDVLLRKVRPGGKFVCIEYHEPHWAHPLKPITSFIFDWLEPFAKGMWRSEIRDFAKQKDLFEWRKQKVFGGLFQKVVATRL
jgi:ubiquinone/menaquinone biosynthesis C-methylase UbiE